MPRIKQPRQSRAKLLKIIDKVGEPNFFETIYSEKVILTLARKHCLEDHLAALDTALRKATEHYYMGGPYGSHDIPELADRAAHLTRLASMAGELSRELYRLSERDSRSLLDTLKTAGAIPGTVASISGALECTTDKHARFFSAHTLRGIERFLADLANATRPRKRPDQPRKGRPSEYGLECFVVVLGHFWHWEAKRPFTLDYHKGAPVSPALAFIVDALTPLDDVPNSAVITAARKIRAEVATHKK
jgi:hypothetical protein